MKTSIVMVLVAALAAPAIAGSKAGVTMPDTVVVDQQQLTLNGMGLREATMFGVHVYVAGLYVEHPTSSAETLIRGEQTKKLVLHFVRDVGHGDIVKAWNEGFSRNATVPIAKIQTYVDQLDAWMPAFHKDDTLAFTYVPNQGVTVEVNGVRKGVIQDADFARSLFAIWLGPKPPTGDLKRGLLGSHPNS
jgi:hypothetical protein